MVDQDDDWDCPLCMEEMDSADRLFHPCPCGYQICRFCWHKISQDMNKLCPACRREYCDEYIQQQNQNANQKRANPSGKIHQTSNPFSTLLPPSSPTPRDSLKSSGSAQLSVTGSSAFACSNKEVKERDVLVNARKHLTSLRVIQKNLVYVIGLSPRIAREEILVLPEYFGQYGKIIKIVVNKRNYVGINSGHLPSASVYVTYSKREEASRAIQLVDGTVFDGRILRASYGTTKYCTFFLRGIACQNPGCMYLHEQGEEQDSFTKEQMAEGFHLDRFIPRTQETDGVGLPREAFSHPPFTEGTIPEVEDDSERADDDHQNQPFRVPSLSDILVVMQPSQDDSFSHPKRSSTQPSFSGSRTPPPPPTSSTFFTFNPFSSTSSALGGGGGGGGNGEEKEMSPTHSKSESLHFLSKTAPRLPTGSFGSISTSSLEIAKTNSHSTVNLWSGNTNSDQSDTLSQLVGMFLVSTSSGNPPSIQSPPPPSNTRNPKIPKASETHFISRTLTEALHLAIAPVMVPDKVQQQQPSSNEQQSSKTKKPVRNTNEALNRLLSSGQLSSLFSASLNQPWDRSDNSVGFRYKSTTPNDSQPSSASSTSTLSHLHAQELDSMHKQATGSLSSFLQSFSPELLVELLDKIDLEALAKSSSNSKFTTLETLLVDGLERMAATAHQYS